MLTRPVNKICWQNLLTKPVDKTWHGLGKNDIFLSNMRHGPEKLEIMLTNMTWSWQTGFWQTWYWHSLNLILKKKHTRSLGLILNLVSYFYSWKWGFLGLIMTNILYKFLFCLFWSLNLQVTHEMMDFYREFFSFYICNYTRSRRYHRLLLQYTG